MNEVPPIIPANAHYHVSNILLLGGTGTALTLAQELSQQGYQLTYSIAGLVRQPDLPCQVISGGFTQFGGMAQFVRSQRISLIIDATHPYAVQISHSAATTASECGIPCWRLQRPCWEQQTGDNWQTFQDWETLTGHLMAYRRVFLSHGQLSRQQLEILSRIRTSDQQFIIRTAAPIALNLPEWIQPLAAIGPFDFQDELALLQGLAIEAIVSKNSGGSATYGKIQAARELRVPVLMLQRPELPVVTQEFFSREELFVKLQT
ncbi:MAG: cobalt-precorrin-6A reductase [Thiothrix nivea]|nr:MAG: cobalt-precorrin-6A reductase [Thiothrix nivea]